MRKILYILFAFILFTGLLKSQTYTINAHLLVKGDISMEGNADDDFEGRFTLPSVTADRTWTLPDTDLNFGSILTDPMSTRGDIIYRNSSNVTARLGLGSNLYILQSNGTDLAWTGDPEFNSIKLTAISAPAHAAGILFYDTDDDELAFYDSDAATKLNVGSELRMKVRNNSGSAIADFTPVYQTGAVGNRATIALAKADAEATAMVIAVTTSAINNNANASATTKGTINGVDTDGSPYGESWAAKEEIFLSATTAGAFTNVAPTGNNMRVSIGKVLTAANNGSFEVKIDGANVVGVSSSVDDRIVTFDGTSGKRIQDSGIDIADVIANTTKVTMDYPGVGIGLSTGSAWGASITDNSANWNTAYTDRLKWDGGATGLVASTGRTSLGGTTIGQNIFVKTNPSAITFGRANADNTFDWLSATNFRTAIGVDPAGTDNSTDVTIGTANGLSLITQQLSMALSNGSVTGTLNSTNWNTFNNKTDIGDAVTIFNGTAWRSLYINATGDVTEFVLGANGTFLESNGASSAPAYRSLLAGDIPDISGTYQPLDGALTSISALVYVSPSFIKLTADDTYAVRTLSEVKQDLSLDNVTNVATSDAVYDGTAWNGDTNAATKNAIRDKIETLPGGHDAVTLNANATAAGLSLSTQEINYRASTNAQSGYATAAQITAQEANTTHSTDNSQAHSDYLINNGNDSTSGILTAADFAVTNDNSTNDVEYVPMVLHGTDATPPVASGFPIGTIYIQYTP